MELTLSGWVVAVLAAVAVGLSKGGLSMVGMLGVPLLSLAMPPVQAAGVLLPVFVISDVVGLVAYRRGFDRKVMATLLPGAIAGIVLGGLTAHLVSGQRLNLVVGLIGLVFALNALWRRNATPAPRAPGWGAGSFWGLLTGYTSFVSHAGAPPYQVYVQPLRMQAVTFAGTTTVFFAIVNAVKLIPYAMLGQFSSQNLHLAALLFLPACISVWVGLRLVRIMPERVFYAFITWALLIVSAKLIWEGL